MTKLEIMTADRDAWQSRAEAAEALADTLRDQLREPLLVWLEKLAAFREANPPP